ncbi:MAG: peptide chain release factor N(5)-glutamine methyltransferase [Micavibrio aeruginosavorus]|uniref:Release factor glutamine methyltransferase n=1 Tax=Micavibrio aeruginosavorus TaxID=349221 RepID=A0A7T5UFW4_9BACT|nr:MAG: peptide chain release factor N(5)-glutamine methyltransferase [Micavibrio aeruginosavorus]
MVKDILRLVRTRFSEAGINTPDLDARILVRHFLNLSDADLITGTSHASENQMVALQQAIERRLSGEPVSRIIGYREFWGMKMKVTPDTLDPRPDTERLVEMAIESCREEPPQNILDLGTGTGCILLALLKEFPESRGIGIDINSGAVDVSRENMENNGLSGRASFFIGDWHDSLPLGDVRQFDLIVSNPPYIPESEIESLSQEVKNHDPILALSGGSCGLDAYKSIIMKIKNLLAPEGACLLEIGRNQHAEVQRLVEDSGLCVLRIGADYSGILRVVEIGHGDK